MRAPRVITAMMAVVGLAWVAAAAPPPASTVSKYVVEVDLVPAAGRVVAAARLRLLRDDYLRPDLVFGLHEGFAIKKLAVNSRDLPFTTRSGAGSRLRPSSREVVVQLPEDLRRPELELEVAYEGTLEDLPQFGTPEAAETGRFLDDEVSSRRVELSGYSTWYPQVSGFGPTFAADLAVTLPAGWTVVCTGEPQVPEELEGRRRTRWLARATNDLVVVAAPDLKVIPIRRGSDAVEIYHTRLPRAFSEREADNVRRTLDLYAGILGEPEGGAATVRVVYSPREHGQGGYSRVPMLVLSEGRVIAALAKDPRLSLLHGTAHEAAHFWWRFGAGQGDWINESFAEYFALLAVERIDAPAQYESALARARAVVRELPAEAPSLAEVPPSNEGYGATIRYQKGALMVAWIRSILGDDAFFAACRAFYEARRGRPTSTADFENFWTTRVGAEHVPDLELWLTSPGGLPTLVAAHPPAEPTGGTPRPGMSR